MGEGHIHPFAKAWVEASAGHRIIVVGDYCRPGDLPSGIELTTGEKALLSNRPSNDNHDADARSSAPQSLYLQYIYNIKERQPGPAPINLARGDKRRPHKLCLPVMPACLKTVGLAIEIRLSRQSTSTGVRPIIPMLCIHTGGIEKKAHGK